MNNYKNKTICESLDAMRFTIKKSNLKESEKIQIMEYVEEIQFYANKMEDRLIEKIEILKSEGFVKCNHCKVWDRPQMGMDGLIYSCCGGLIS